MFSKLLTLSLFITAGVMALPAERRDDDSSSLSARTTTYSGRATFYSQNGAVGACGQLHSDSDLIGAISPSFYGTNAVSPHCGKKIHITSGSKTVTITVADECPVCSTDDIDLSTGAFEAIASLEEGIVPITWYFA